MNDLAQINQANAKAVARSTSELRAGGSHVVIEYSGLSVMGAESFAGEGAFKRAKARFDEINAAGGSHHSELLLPTAEPLEA